MARRAGSGRNTVKKRSNKTVKLRHAKTKIASGRSSADPQEQIGALTRELIEARKQQTATSKILGVISRSPDDLRPVFDAIVQNAGRLCESTNVSLFRVEAELMRHVASHGDAVTLGPGATRPLTRGSLAGRAIIDGKTIHIDDSRAPAIAAEFPDAQPAIAQTGIRTSLAVPLLKGTIVLGAIVVRRTEVRPFSHEQIELVQNFAAQAVIAIENTRLLNELRQRTDDLSESLEQQTATSEVLKVISSSPGDLDPIFQTMLEKARSICQAEIGLLLRYDDGAFTVVAETGVPPAFAEWWRSRPTFRPSPDTLLGRVAASRKADQLEDLAATTAYRERNPMVVAGVELGGMRSLLTVPIVKDQQLVGAIGIYRQEVRPFTDKQIALVQNFAAQAVIAIENARLLNELRQRTDDLSESLEQQTATSEVLKVISASQGELEPVFNTMLENAVRICGAQLGNLALYDGRNMRVAAMHNPPPAYHELRRREPVAPSGNRSLLGVIAASKSVMRFDDLTVEPYVSWALPKLAGAKSAVGVPMLRDGELAGAIVIYRTELRAFTDKQIELVKNFAAQAVIAIENARLLNELRQRTDDLSESLEQQTATSDVLKVISSSPGELEPVFNAMLAKATRICEAKVGNMFLREGDGFRAVAVHGDSDYAEWFRREPLVAQLAGSPLDRLIRTKQLIHIPDLRQDQSYIDGHPRMVSLVDTAGARTHLVVPMLKEDELIGAIVIYRQEVRPFTDKQIELVQNFAAQAVIAIENARLLSELRESLEYQTAISGVLNVISRSPSDIQPVLDTIAETAQRLCQAEQVYVMKLHGNRYCLAAAKDAEASRVKYLREHPIDPSRGSVVGRVALDRRTVHIADAKADPEYTLTMVGESRGYRTILGVPLFRDGIVTGVIVLTRGFVQPYTDRQIELVNTFADQAVIAIENVRLFDEVQARTRDLSESLEQQTATSEVLKVISSSPGNLQSVFQAMLDNATRICGAGFGTLFRIENDEMEPVAHHNVPAVLVKHLTDRGRIKPRPGSTMQRVVRSRDVVHVVDLLQDSDAPGNPAVQFAGARTYLGVPMLKEGELVGAIVIYRLEVRPFTGKQIELVQNFAAQAVIAIENTRLLNELRESLQQQTATADVLKTISRSAFDLQIVLDTLVESAARLCEADIVALARPKDATYGFEATFGASREFHEYVATHPATIDRGTAVGRTLVEGKIVHIHDVLSDPDYRYLEGQKLSGVRTILGVPLMREGSPIGVITLQRQVVRPFTDKQIELAATFADQAAIAIENTRLLNELRQRTDDLSEALEQQTATSEVLKVISSSPGDLKPVFDVLLSNATRMCGAKFGALSLYDGEVFRSIAMMGAPPAFAGRMERDPIIRVTPGHNLERLVHTKAFVHIPDLEIDRNAAPIPYELAGARAALNVPLLKDSALIGSLLIYRQEKGAFNAKQIELVQSFAAQAVIAIENTRLLNELRQRTDDLSESLEQQTATSEVLKVISSSPGELEPVFRVMLENATRLCEAKFGMLFRCEGDQFRFETAYNTPPALTEFQRQRGLFRSSPGASLDRLLQARQVVRSADDREEAVPSPSSKLGGARSHVVVPMFKDNELVGAITIYRQEVRPFTDKQIELVQNFAAQAVIAIENTRLLSELRESLQQQTATADVLKIISRSTFDLKTVLNTLVESAARLSESDFATLNRQHADGYRQVASYGLTASAVQMIEASPLKAGRGSIVGRTLMERKPIQIVDVLSDPEFEMIEATKRIGSNTILGVPLMREGEPIGVMTLQRRSKQPYTDKQIELLTTFADQAVIAIENVRLFESVQTRTRELAQSLEDLQSAQDRLVQTQKLASLGQLTAGIAHEIKNPLNFVNNFSAVSTELIDELQDILKGASVNDKARADINELTDTLRGNLEKIVQHGKRADSIVKNMLLHSREGSGEHRPVDINAIVEESLNLAYHGARAEKQGFNITLERSFDPAAGAVDLFPQEITRVMLNLISNGFYAATKRKGEIGRDGYEPTLAAATKSLGDSVEIRIRDNGTGIPPEVKEKMFNPFFTTKPAGEGTGLGLSLSYDIIVKQHAGSIEVDTQPGEFTEFRIVLPRGAATVAKSGERS